MRVYLLLVLFFVCTIAAHVRNKRDAEQTTIEPTSSTIEDNNANTNSGKENSNNPINKVIKSIYSIIHKCVSMFIKEMENLLRSEMKWIRNSVVMTAHVIDSFIDPFKVLNNLTHFLS